MLYKELILLKGLLVKYLTTLCYSQKEKDVYCRETDILKLPWAELFTETIQTADVYSVFYGIL